MSDPLYRESWKDLSRQQVKDKIKIRSLNDRLRKVMPTTKDTILFVGDLSAEDVVIQTQVYSAVRAFDAFTEDNDPHGEHDCASLTVEINGEPRACMFKIDYYDQAMQFHSPDASDQELTRRVMSILYAVDY